ncbi:MAG TPA: ATP-binding protein [Sporichthyaceae bacterium]
MNHQPRFGTLRARLRLVLAVAAVVVAVGAFITLGALHSLDRDTRTLTDRFSPARATASDLLSAWLDQETGVRGYVLSRDQTLLSTYTAGQAAVASDNADLRRLLPTPAIGQALDRVAAAGNAWHSDYADPTILAVRSLPKNQPLALNQKVGKARFDAVRTALSGLTVEIAAERAVARHDVKSGLTRMRVLTLSAFGLIVLAGVAVWWALRRTVLRPIDQLGRETRTVADGAFDHKVEVVGPTELQALGGDVETMRVRIVTALADARVAEQEVRSQALELEQQAEDLRRSNDELEQFAYVASHDLQEPLRKVASFCQMLQRRYSGQLDEKADQYIEFAVDGAKRMQQLINDLLTFSRVGRTSEGMTTVDMAEIAGHAVDALATARTESRAVVDIGELPAVTGDDTLLTQLFQNLIGNAIKFRAPGRAPRVELRAVREDEFWHFTCSDNGIGIDPEYAERVFVIFQRLHPKDQYAGTGIGLSLCKKIVEYHGGRIWLEIDGPADAEGSVVHWTLPV